MLPTPLRRPIPTVLALLVGLAPLAAGAGGCASDQQVIAQANDVHTQLEPTVVTDPELDAYVQKVGDRIVTAARQMHAEGGIPDADAWMFEDVSFHLVASPTLNAFTTGGKHVYLYSQLFEESQTEDSFAAVVGHEFGHIIGRHVQDSMNQQYAMIGAAGAAALAGAALAEDGKRTQTAATVGGLTLAGGQIVGLSFGRNNEREADELGFEFYVRAGYDPARFGDFFKNMIEQGYGGGGGIQGYLSSHPDLAERVRSAEERAGKVPPDTVARYRQPPIASAQELESLKNRSKQFTAMAAAEAAKPGATPFKEGLAILAAFPACVGGLSDGIPPEEQPGANRPGAGRISR
jgi:predicted Zn-dependent protease